MSQNLWAGATLGQAASPELRDVSLGSRVSLPHCLHSCTGSLTGLALKEVTCLEPPSADLGSPSAQLVGTAEHGLLLPAWQRHTSPTPEQFSRPLAREWLVWEGEGLRPPSRALEL